jgi:hypothetical protein
MSTEFCRSCGSCGFPMSTPEDHAGGDPGAAYCSSCAEASGRLKPFDEVLQVNADYLVREQGLDAQAAREMARALLAAMPPWRGRA